MNETDLFNWREADKRKSQSMEAVAMPAKDWINLVLPIVKRVSNTTREFTTDRIEWELDRAGIAAPKEKRAMGPLMSKAAGLDYVEKTDRVVPSTMPSNHRRPKAIWRSKILTKW